MPRVSGGSGEPIDLPLSHRLARLGLVHLRPGSSPGSLGLVHVRLVQPVGRPSDGDRLALQCPLPLDRQRHDRARHAQAGADVPTALRLIRPGARIVSICTGAFVLAAAGLLDGRPATTHWKFADDFARLYPGVQLDADVLFVDDGDVLTSAGLAAGVDLCLHLLRRDHGAEVANHVARYCVVPPWREGGQAQFIERPLPSAPSASRSTTARAREWALEHLEDDLDVPALAASAGMSVRTFTRRFRAETGRAPGAWLIDQRVRRAQRLLEATDLPVDAVAARSGLGTAASLRQHLRAVAGVSPSDYRRTFRGRSA